MEAVMIHIAVEAHDGFSRKYGCDVRDPKTGHLIVEKSIDAIKARFPEGTKFVETGLTAGKFVVR